MERVETYLVHRQQMEQLRDKAASIAKVIHKDVESLTIELAARKRDLEELRHILQ